VLEPTRYQGSSLLTSALGAGEIDVAPFGYSSFALAVQNAGMTNLRIFADEDRDGVGGHFTTQFMVRKDGGPTTVEGLKGKVLATNAETVASGNIGCLTQLRAQLFKLGSPIRVRHTMQVLRDGYEA
jgi:ABC-type phosphate/phosphonate transport system substrate-binding protein